MMSQLTIWTRSFHPNQNFGLGGLFYRGDHRGFSCATSGVTARIWHFVKVGLDKAAIVGKACGSNKSENAILPLTQDYHEARTQPRYTQNAVITPYRQDGDQHGTVLVTYAGQNFAMPAAGTDVGHWVASHVVPDLDVTNSVNFHVDRTSHKINLTCRMAGDGFPNAESFVVDSANVASFLVSHIRIGSAIAQLPGGRALAMGSSAQEADWTSADQFGEQTKCYWCLDYSIDCSPTDLKALMHGNPCSIAAWNHVHTDRDAKGPPFRRFLDNFWAHDFGTPASQMP